MLSIKIILALFLPAVPDIATAALTKTIEHDIQGDFKVEGHTIVINDFSYDGVGLDAFFYVGTSTGCPSGEGTRLGELEETSSHSEGESHRERGKNSPTGQWILLGYTRRPAPRGE